MLGCGVAHLLFLRWQEEVVLMRLKIMAGRASSELYLGSTL
jgi:hypothetical protein